MYALIFAALLAVSGGAYAISQVSASSVDPVRESVSEQADMDRKETVSRDGKNHEAGEYRRQLPAASDSESHSRYENVFEEKHIDNDDHFDARERRAVQKEIRKDVSDDRHDRDDRKREEKERKSEHREYDDDDREKRSERAVKKEHSRDHSSEDRYEHEHGDDDHDDHDEEDFDRD